MSSPSLLLILLVITCLQSFTTAQNASGLRTCCWKFQKNKIRLRLITGYEVTWRACSKPGIIFFMETGHRVCADPKVKWVKEHRDKIDQSISVNPTQPQTTR